MFRRAIPVLHVTSSMAAEQYFCVGLGFKRRFAYRPDEPKPDPCYMGLERDGSISNPELSTGFQRVRRSMRTKGSTTSQEYFVRWL